MDERRRYSPRRRPSDAEIRRTHDLLATSTGSGNAAGGDDAASLPDPLEAHATEPTSGDPPGADGQPTAPVDVRRQRAIAALRSAISGAGRGRHRTRQAVTVPQVAAEPTPAIDVAETHDEPAPVVRDVTHVQIEEEFRGLPELSGAAEPHWSERAETRGRRYQDPQRTDQE